MSLREWGIFLDSFATRHDALEFIAATTKALAKLDMPQEEKETITFQIHPTYDNIRGRDWLYGVYMQRKE
jgi:hypothetical protein